MTLKGQTLYEFGSFRLDPANRQLLDEGRAVSLTPKALEILVILLQNGNGLTTKEELMRRVWPDSFVEEANLSVNISALRKLLGETPEGLQYIETVPKLGYRFVAPVREQQESSQPAPPPPPLPTSGDERNKAPAPVEVMPATKVFAPSRRWL